MSAAQDALAQLRGQGLTLAQIGAAVGRDPSQLSQISRGVYPGTNLAGPLADLAAGRVVQPPALRSGREAPRAAYVRQGQVVVAHESAAGVRRTLANVARGEGHVRVVVRGSYADGRPFVLDPFARGGIRAAELRRLVDARLAERGVTRPTAADTTRAMAEVLSEQRGDGTTGSGLPAGVVIDSVSVSSL